MAVSQDQLLEAYAAGIRDGSKKTFQMLMGPFTKIILQQVKYIDDHKIRGDEAVQLLITAITEYGEQLLAQRGKV